MSAITDTKVDRLLEGLKVGMTRRAACAAAGISKTSLYRMLENDPDGTFGTLIENAEGEAEAAFSEIIAKATLDPKNWTAAAWWLERRHPQDYARRDKVEMTGKDGGPIESRTVSELPDHERAALADAIRAHLRGEAEPARDPEGDRQG